MVPKKEERFKIFHCFMLEGMPHVSSGDFANIPYHCKTQSIVDRCSMVVVDLPKTVPIILSLCGDNFGMTLEKERNCKI